MTTAHGLGGASDLPIPATYAIAGGCAALTVSFVILLIAWRRPRFDDPGSGRPVPSALAHLIDSPGFSAALRVAGMLFAGFVVWAAIAGQDLLTNPVFGIAYVWLWVGIVPASLLFGPWFRAVSPARTLHLLVTSPTGDDPAPGIAPLPPWVGYWPAAVGLFAFVWFELVYPSATYLGPLRLWFAVYVGAMVVGGALFGTRWFERADPFEVYSTLVGHLSIWGRRPDGTLVFRNPLANLDRIPAAPGLVAVIAVLLGSTAFDSFRESNLWLRYTQATEANVPLINTGLLLGTCALVGLTFTAATMATGAETDAPRSVVPRLFAHSVVPIIVGYMVAHYLTFFVETGQQTLIRASDPLGNGSDLFGTGDWAVNYWLSSHPATLATIKVVAIVTGHVLGAIAAHDRAIRLLPPRQHATGQLPLLSVMVLYTFTGLYLLFGI